LKIIIVVLVRIMN